MVRELSALVGAEPEGRVVEVGRFDLATERDFDDPAEGLLLLRAMRALRPPGYKLNVYEAQDGRVETVAVVTSKRSRRVFRAYDKSVESGSGPPGSQVRFEAQVRRSSAQRRGPCATANSDLRVAFGRTIEPFMTGESVTVTSRAGVVNQLAAKVSAGELGIRRAEGLVGAAELLRRFGRGIYATDNQSARRLRALRAAGVAVDDDLPEGAVIPVGQLLESALDQWSTLEPGGG